MSRREEAKEFNRARIRAAAEEIIRTEGMEKLTMRRLAEQAEVSLRTPYNLFGSKTDVLISLIDEAQFELSPLSVSTEQITIVEQLLALLDRIEGFFGSDEEYFRGIYASIMTSDHPEAREMAVSRSVALARMRLQQAAVNGELAAGTDTDKLGRHLAIQLLAVLGMWGSGFFSNRECIAQVRESWCAALLQHCSETSRPACESATKIDPFQIGHNRLA
jgi:AcrR family transcriptional regulator